MQCIKNPVKVPANFDLQGHRGCRGLYPENTLPAFAAALSFGATTLEMDVVISADNQVVVSHEPWMRSALCTLPNGSEIDINLEQQHLIYEMPYSRVKQYDCGSKKHPDFPQQKSMLSYKPLLSEVIEYAELQSKKLRRPLPFYNIETKCTPEGDGKLHPSPDVFCSLVADIIEAKAIKNRSIIQSFDVRTLQIFQKRGYSQLSLLIEDFRPPQENIATLGFIPAIYSPEYTLVDMALVQFCKSQTMKLIPWTVNDPEDMRRLINLGVDGLITDFPNLLWVEN